MDYRSLGALHRWTADENRHSDSDRMHGNSFGEACSLGAVFLSGGVRLDVLYGYALEPLDM